MNLTQRIGSIDSLKFLFAIGIAYFHFVASQNEWMTQCSNLIVRGLIKYSVNLRYLVDFFFIAAGYFLVMSYKNLRIIDFIKNKYARLVPLMALYTFTIFFFNKIGWTTPAFKDESIIFQLLLIDNIGLTLQNSGVAWFLSAYFFVICLYYTIIRSCNSKHLIIFVLMFLSYSFLIHQQKGDLAGTFRTYYNVLNVGVLRGFGGMGLGYFLGIYHKEQLSHKMHQNKTNVFMSIIEIFLFGYLLFFLLYRNTNENAFCYIIAFVCVFIFSIKNLGVITYILNKNMLSQFGKYAFAIYMVHEPVSKIFVKPVLNNYPKLLANYPIFIIGSYLGLVFICAILSYHFVEVPGAKLMKKLLFPQPATGVKNVENLERERERDSSCQAS